MRRPIAPARPVDAARTLAQAARVQALARADAIAFEFEGRSTTYAQFHARANRVANGLLAAGVARGEHVCYLGKNSDSYFEILFGAARAGAVLTPINWRLAEPEIAWIINDCAARVLFVGPEFVALVIRMKAALPPRLEYIALEGGLQPAYEDWLGAQGDAAPAVAEPAAGEVALQLYTSGTTGRPKGAMLSHANLLAWRPASGAAVDAWRLWDETDVALLTMPVFHIGGIGWGLMSFMNGARAVIAREFDAGRVLDFIERHRITRIFIVPAALRIVINDPRARAMDLSRMRYILYGASPMPLELLRECIEVFRCGFVQMYGMTETAGTIVALPPEDHSAAGSPRMRSAGRALPGVELAIVDANAAAVAPGTIGEIVTRSVANMAGYWNNPEATARCIDAAGWLHTGDLGYLDEAGYLYLHDRIKDVIISGGENIYPAEVENALCDHPDIAEAAVIGVPDEKWGEAVKAIVVAKPGRDPQPDELIRWTRRQLAPFKAPRSVEFTTVLPRNSAGKILRRELRKPYWEGRDRSVN